MRVILIGGLKNGKMIAKYLNDDRHTELLRVYVLEDKRGEKVSDFITFDDVIQNDKIKKIDKINKYEDEITKLQPDIIFVVGWSQLVSDKIIKSAKVGVIGFHPAKLPKDRGRSVLAWQISEGYKEGCVSMIWIDQGIDSGNLIGQKNYNINYNDTIRDVLDKVYDICLDLVETYFPIINNGNKISIKQNDTMATYRRKRVEKDGIINWNNYSFEIYNLIRALTEPYPGAVSYYKGKKIIILSAVEAKSESIYDIEKPGTILEFRYNKGMTVKTKDICILVKEIKINNEYILENELQKYFTLGHRFGDGE
jgi:methionyl-tRNA formyltransferase